MKKVAFVLALGVAALGLPRAVAAQQQDGNLVVEGAQVYGANCARCHNLRSPTEFTDLQWRTIIAQMRARANLTRRQARAVLAFVQSTNGVGGAAPGGTAMNDTPASVGTTGGQTASGLESGHLKPAQQRALDAYVAKLKARGNR